jgi:Mor family transcriptional regulator
MDAQDIVKTTIFNADNEEINEIAELIKIRKEMLSKQKMNEMKVGDKVFFMSKGSKINGTIRKKNIKRIVVDTNKGGWNVPASMLTLVEEW